MDLNYILGTWDPRGCSYLPYPLSSDLKGFFHSQAKGVYYRGRMLGARLPNQQSRFDFWGWVQFWRFFLISQHLKQNFWKMKISKRFWIWRIFLTLVGNTFTLNLKEHKEFELKYPSIKDWQSIYTRVGQNLQYLLTNGFYVKYLAVYS